MRKHLYFKKKSFGQTDLWPGKKPTLSSLDLELTERCNCNCIFCCINQPAKDNIIKNRELSTDELKSVLTQAASLGCLTVRFTGGEPLLRDDFSELYLFARKLGLRIMIFTNATLITPELVKLFLDIPPLEKIEITVYGMKKESYEKVTNTQDSFEAAWRGINLLIENKIPFVVKGAILPSNKDEIEEFDAWALTIPWMKNKPSYSLFFDLRYRRDSKIKNRSINNLRLSPAEGLKIISRDEPLFSQDLKKYCSQFMHPAGDKIFTCGAGLDQVSADAYGFIYPCLMLKHPDTGYHLKQGSIKDCIENFFPEVRKKRAKNSVYLAHCANCFLRGLCDMCPGKSWVEHGTLDTPVDYACEIAHEQARYLGFLKDHENAWEVKEWEKRLDKINYPKMKGI